MKTETELVSKQKKAILLGNAEAILLGNAEAIEQSGLGVIGSQYVDTNLLFV